MRIARFVQLGAGFAAAAAIAVVATAPLGSRAADHLDAPNLAAREDADINDVYVFQASAPGRTAIAVTTSPAAGVIGPIDYATNVRYKINMDRNGDAVEDLAYVLDFSAPASGSQSYTVTRYTGANAAALARASRSAADSVVSPTRSRAMASCSPGSARAPSSSASPPLSMWSWARPTAVPASAINPARPASTSSRASTPTRSCSTSRTNP